MEAAADLTLREISSIALNWAMAIAFFATQAFIATGGVQALVG